MYISDIALSDFRNYEKEKTSFSPNINVLVGPNAQGKTNLLEAIYYLARGYSFKNIKDSDIIREGQKSASLDAQIIKGRRRKIIHIDIGNKKSIFINGIEISTLKDMKNHFDLVLFFPDHLRVIKEGPNLRRSFIDEGIITINSKYRKAIDDYDRLLDERNTLIKRNNGGKYFKEQLVGITRTMAVISETIINNRKAYIENLSKIADKKLRRLSKNNECLELNYFSSLEESILKDDIYKKMMARIDIDIERGFTGIGPHRDDVEIKINERPAKLFASQGQMRSIILTMKLAEIELIKEFKDDYPILLLDDVFSELDHSRRAFLLKEIGEAQALITTNFFDQIRRNSTKLIKIKEGNISCS